MSLANIVVIGGVLFGLSGASHAATISPLAAERLATMLAAPALSLPAFSTDNHTFVFSLLVGGLVSMTLGAVTLTRTFAHDVRKAGGMSALDRL